MTLGERRIGFIGAGAMAEALAGGLLASGVARERLLASDVDEGRRLAVLFQVNLSGEPWKGGVEPDELPALIEASGAWSSLEPVGLMTLPAAAPDPEAARATFAQLRELLEKAPRTPRGARLRELSMGMSEDFEVAIEEGATIVRVGTAIFGPREEGDA